MLRKGYTLPYFANRHLLSTEYKWLPFYNVKKILEKNNLI